MSYEPEKRSSAGRETRAPINFVFREEESPDVLATAAALSRLPPKSPAGKTAASRIECRCGYGQDQAKGNLSR